MDHASSTSTTPEVLWRCLPVARVMGVAVLAVTALLGAFLVFEEPGELFAWGFAVVVVALVALNVSTTRRSCTLVDGYLLAHGRFAARRVDLRDLRQVAIGPAFHVWIQTHHPLDKRGGHVLYLRMIPTGVGKVTRPPNAEQAAKLIRARATAVGAQLDPPPSGHKQALGGKRLIFSI
jgi:hypothetical protein